MIQRANFATFQLTMFFIVSTFFSKQIYPFFLSTRTELYWDIHEMFKPSLLRYSRKSQIPLDIQDKKGYPSLGEKDGRKC